MIHPDWYELILTDHTAALALTPSASVHFVLWSTTCVPVQAAALCWRETAA